MTAAVPETLDQALSPEWLTAALRPRFPGVEVTAVRPGPVVDRVSTNACFTIECESGVPEGLSPHLCVKGYFNDIGRVSRQIGEPKAYFYRDMAADTGVRTLRSVYADISADTRHGVIITEDVLAGGGTFLDATSTYTPEQAARSLAQFARLHARTWGRTQRSEPSWLAPRLAHLFAVRGLAEITYNYEGPIGAGVPDEIRSAQTLFDQFRQLVAIETASPAPQCVIHGDAHVGNLYLDSDGRPSLVDWQLVQRGRWYLDVGYHIASTLTVEDRRRSERDLLRHYLDTLAEYGAPAPSWDEAWHAISRGILLGLYLWSITIQVDPSLTTELLVRMGTAAADHDVYDTATGRM
ncbi:phosphotransferase [Nocardia miyunensis]|uniref:phosphotransferase n=1 Tax=Nocardia miyunensis TaxID=282684 RepID=UPI00082C542B|nr:phosphotransferase [Nocardia miyunensis]